MHHSAIQVHRDRNYGAVLIVWDRLLGTFSDGADVAPTWGVSGEPETVNPVASNLGPWRALIARVRSDGLVALWRW